MSIEIPGWTCSKCHRFNGAAIGSGDPVDMVKGKKVPRATCARCAEPMPQDLRRALEEVKRLEEENFELREALQDTRRRVEHLEELVNPDAYLR